MAEILRYADPAQVAAAAAAQFVALAHDAVAARGTFAVALSGGSTPKALYTLLAVEPYATQVAWEAVHLFWGDERMVPPDHPQSNYRLACETLINHVPLPDANIHRMPGEARPAAAALAYEQLLRAFFGEQPRFDLVLLGMGEDGHTASLFPGTAALAEEARWVVANHVPQLDTWRLTLTLPAINAAAHVTFLVTGASKAAPLAVVLNGGTEGKRLPAGCVAPSDGHLFWLLDEAAASALRTSG